MASAIAIKAATWWADRIYRQGPLDQKITRRDGTDPDSERVEIQVNAVLALFGARGNGPDISNRQPFIDSLASLIDKELQTKGESDMYVDYDPDGVLRIVEKEFELGYGEMPFKTGMQVTKTGIDVKEGYGASWVTLTGEV